MADKGEKVKPDRKTQELLRQFLNHDGPKGHSAEYQMRYDYAFKLTAAERLKVDQLVNSGMTFAEAFEARNES